MATVTHTVVKGDTLWDLAKKYGTTVDDLVRLNNIPNRNLIYVGQVLYISGKPSTSDSSSSGSSTSSNTVTITAFGLQADTDRDIFAIWKWDKSETKNYTVTWKYYVKENDLWFEGSTSDVTIKESIYTAPANATIVRVRIKPVSNTYTSKDKEVSYWTADWSSAKDYDLTQLPPTTPAAPSVTIKDYTLTARLDNLDVNGTEIEFEIVKNDSSVFKVGKATIITSSASYSTSINAGDNYKVRARSVRGGKTSDWSQYSANTSTKPSAPGRITTYKATSKTSVLLEWTSVATADKYEIQYATKKEYFEGSNATTSIGDILTNRYEITGLDTGERYFFRVRAINDKGESGYTDIVSVVIGTTPGPPTTWSSTSTVISGEDLVLYWVHNSEDQSREQYAEVEVYYGETKFTHVVENTDPEEDDVTSNYVISTGIYSEGTIIKWRVRTSGITGEYGEWSIQRTVNVYAPPTLSLELLNKDMDAFSILESFPFYIKATVGPETQKPLSFNVSIISNDSYTTVDEIGNNKVVIEGQEVYTGFHDISENLLIEMTPAKIDLHNNISYTVNCIVAMDSGLTAEDSSTFTVSWVEQLVEPNAEVSIDRNTLTTNIRPYCTYYPTLYYKVSYIDSKWLQTDILLDPLTGISVDNAFTDGEGYVVYAGYVNNILTHFCMLTSPDPVPVPDITLSVYRREFDGSFIEIGVGLKNLENTYVTDPHPSLDYARYRIIAISDITGAVSYTDLPAIPINEIHVIIQWDEQWRDLDVIDDITEVKPSWAGSMIKIPYNINVSESNDGDVTLIEYIGRRNPVSYYGTQIGVKSSWDMEIPKTDIETLYALRRLAIWMGDVYVREPSGSGYWANISVSFDRKHKDVTIPISMSITRVEGGV